MGNSRISVLLGAGADGCEDFLYQGVLLLWAGAGALVLRESPERNFAGAAWSLAGADGPA
jgi:hypothetical protein